MACIKNLTRVRFLVQAQENYQKASNVSTGYKLTDILEAHFLEIIKLADKEIPRGKNDKVIEWMDFWMPNQKE